MIRSLLSLTVLLLTLFFNVQAQSFFGEPDYKPMELTFRDEKRLPLIMKEELLNAETGEYEYLADLIYSYNEKKDIIQIIRVKGVDSLEKTKLSYDAKGRTTGTFFYYRNSERNEWLPFNNELTEYAADGNVKKTVNYFYDVTGTEIVKTEGSMVEKFYDGQNRLKEYINWKYVDTGWVKETSESYFYTGTSIWYDSLNNFTYYSPFGPMLPIKKKVTSIKRNQQGKPLEYIIRREPESIQEQDTILVSFTYNDSGSVKDMYYWKDDQLLFRLANRTVKYSTPENHIVTIFYQEYGDTLTPQFKVTLFLDAKRRLNGYDYLLHNGDAWTDYQRNEISFIRDKTGILKEIQTKQWQYGDLTEYFRTRVVSYVESGEVAIRDASPLQEIFVTPNPAGSFIKLNDTKGEKVVIYNSEGMQVIISEKTEDGIVDIECLTPGLYFLKTSGENGQTAGSTRFIKQ